jgi:protein-tyrosine-phosphatase
MTLPLFVCHANCARSVLAYYLYQHLCNGAPALSAGLEAGTVIAPRVQEMLACWRIDASAHRARQLDRRLCEEATAIFVMAAPYTHRLLLEYGFDLASKTYLFADPFSRPARFHNGEYRVFDPSSDRRPVHDLLREFSWFRERVLQIRLLLLGDGRPAIPAAEYWPLLKTVDPRSH